MGYSPEKDQLQKKQSAVFAFLNEKRGGKITAQSIYPEKSFFKIIFFLPGILLFSRHTSRL